MERYKLERLAYGSLEKEELIVPDGTKFFCFNSYKSKLQSENKIKITINSYVSIIPYNEENYNIVNKEDNTIALYVYNLSDEYIILILKDVFPLENLKLSEVLPSIDKPIYFKQCNFKHTPDRRFTDYIKVHPMKEVIDELDVTVVSRIAWFDERVDVNNICREYREIKSVVLSDYFREKSIASTKEEFEKNYNEVISNFEK